MSMNLLQGSYRVAGVRQPVGYGLTRDNPQENWVVQVRNLSRSLA